VLTAIEGKNLKKLTSCATNNIRLKLLTFISIGSLLQKARTAGEIKFGFSFRRAATPTGTYAFVRCSNLIILPG
jgi:hypothetical protein